MPTGRNLAKNVHEQIVQMYEDGLEYGEIAAKLGVPRGSVAGWLWKCRHQKGIRILRQTHVDPVGRRLVSATVTLPRLKFMENWDGRAYWRETYSIPIPADRPGAAASN